MKKIILTLSLTAAISAPALAQTCKSASITPSNPIGQYLDNEDGTITDIVNELMWSRCSLGQAFQGGNCINIPLNYDTWKAALDGAETNKDDGRYSDWRLPNIKELGSIVERSCVAPAIDLRLFPSTPSTPYWSSTFDYRGINTVKGLIIDFHDGTEIVKEVSSHKFVRLVRDL
ncbi:DUF1566 domain-containing protein [Moritella marina ATCC 15381]|uniref:DUF1566 domain-containing protein n=1 Tax=Moritella marina ATCC 15381 TaxID=1202962 RepID=A0A5J6WJG8_MORMI|nr:DUF1566 domain-containing protein [Moritella marina]QFI37290.1 DUF1566 domain-containing protein [Moritella marina ATCC 15381]